MAEEKKISDALDATEAVAEDVATAAASGAVESEEAKDVSISDKLKEAAENIKRVNADAKARKIEQEKLQKKNEDEARARAEEAEKKRLEDEKTVKAIAEQKLAAFAYAENYRKKLQRERTKAVEEERLREKEAREAMLRETRAQEIADHLEEEKKEAQRRNDRATELLNRVTKFAKVGDDGKLSVVEKPQAEPAPAPVAEAPKAPVATDATYDEGDKLLLNIVDDPKMTIEFGDKEEGGISYADAMQRELELLRKQRKELAELFNEHRRFLGYEVKADEPIELEEFEEEIEEEVDPVVTNDPAVASVKFEGEKVDSKKALKKYLKFSSKVLKSFMKQVKAEEKSFARNEDENDSPALIAQAIMTLAKVVEIYCDNLTVCARVGTPKLVKIYTDKLGDAIDDYNENVIAYYDLTGQELTRISAFLPKYIIGGEEAVIPALSYREKYVEIYVEADGTVSIDDSVTTTVITPACSGREILGDLDVESVRDAKGLIKRGNKALSKLDKELNRLNAKIKSNTAKHQKALAEERRATLKIREAVAALDAKYGNYHEGESYNKELVAIERKYGKAVIKAETKIEDAAVERKNLKLLIETFAIEREKLDALCLLLGKVRLYASDKAVASLKKQFIGEMHEYNILADTVSKAIDAPIAKIASSLADEVIRTGSEVLFPKMAYRRELIETVGEDTRIVGDRLKTSFVGDIGGEETIEDTVEESKFAKIYEAEQFAVDVAREDSKGVNSKKTLKKFLRATDKTIVGFKATLRQTNRSIMRSLDEGNVIASLVENIRVRGRFIELRAIRLVTVAKIRRGKMLRRETEALYKEIGKYNLKAIDYYNVTGEQITRISAFLPENLANGTAEIVLPTISYKNNYVEVYAKSNKSDLLSFEDILDKRRAGAYSPIHAKNRRLTENHAVTVTPINPPYSAEEMKEVDDPTNVRGRVKNSNAVRKSRRKLRRGLRRAKRRLIRIERQNKRFDRKIARLNRKHDKAMFGIESQTSAQQRQTPKYHDKLQKVNRKFTNKSNKLQFKRAKANIEQRRMKVAVERFVIEREFFAIACVKLVKLRNYGRPNVIAEAKNNLIKAMASYNKSADACSLLLGEPIARISSSVADEIVRGANREVRLPKIVCFREIIEAVGDKSRVVGERYKYGMYGKNGVNVPLVMGSPFVGTNLEHAPSMGVDADGAPVIGAANPTAAYVAPMYGRNNYVNIDATAANRPASANVIFEAPVGQDTAAAANAAPAQAPFGAMPMMPPVYGFVPPVVSAEKTSEKGDAYEETPVNEDIAVLSKYVLKAMRAKSLIVENKKEYRRYKRRSKKIAALISRLVKRTDALHAYTDKVSAKIGDIGTDSTKKAYAKIVKKLKKLARKSKDQFVISKVHSITLELAAMKKQNAPAHELIGYAADSVEKSIACKFDLDNISAIGKLVEIRCQDLSAAAKINVRRYVRRTRNKLSAEITNYNEHVTEYATGSGDRLTHISTLIPERIARKETGVFIPEILYNKKFAEEKLARAGENASAYTICIPTPEQLAQGATVTTVANPHINETENDSTITEIVSAPAGYTAKELIGDTEGKSAKKCLKEAAKAQSIIDRLIKKLEAKAHKEKKSARKRRRKIYRATARFDRRVIRASGRSYTSAKYQRKLRRISKRYGKSIFAIDRRYPMPELLEGKRLVLECFALEQQKLIAAGEALKAASKANSNKLLIEAKRRFINSVTKYNIAADRTANILSASITHANEGWIDSIILDGALPEIPRIVFKKDLVEVIGEERRVIGERPVRFDGMYTIVFGGNGAPTFSTGAIGGAVFGTAPAAEATAAAAPAVEETVIVAPVKLSRKEKKAAKKAEKKAEKAAKKASKKASKKGEENVAPRAASAPAAVPAAAMTLPLAVAYPYGMNAPQMVALPNGYAVPASARGVNAVPTTEKLGKKELKAAVKASEKSIGESKKVLARKVNAVNRAKSKAKPQAIVDALAASSAVINGYTAIMGKAVAAGDTKLANSYVPALRSEIAQYNAFSATYTKLTGTRLDRISQTLPEDILSGRSGGIVPGYQYSSLGNVYRTLNTEAEVQSEIKRRADKRKIDGIIMDAALEAKVAEQANKDLAVITKYMDFEISMLESARDIENFRYGDEDRVIKHSKKQIGKMIADLKKTHLEALEYERRDNERYYTVVMTDPEQISTKRKNVNTAKLDSIRTRLIVLLNRRDELNSQLSAIYAGTERNLDGSSVNQKWRHIKNSAAESMIRKDRKLAKRVYRVSASKGEKQRMFTLMNKRLDAASTMALCQYRLKHEKNTYRVKKMLEKDIKDCKQQIKLCTADIKWMIQRFRNRKKSSGASWFGGLFLLLLLVGGLVAGYFMLFGQDISAVLNGLMGGK